MTKAPSRKLNQSRPQLAHSFNGRNSRLVTSSGTPRAVLYAITLAAALGLIGCGGGSSSSTSLGATRQTLYVANIGGITEYPTVGLGDIAPSAVIRGSNTLLSLPVGVAIDSAARIYVTDARAASVSIFAAGTNGDVAPTTLIAGPNTGLISPQGITVDSNFNMYVADDGANGGAGAVLMFSAGSNGNVAPAAILAGPNTGLAVPVGIGLFNTTLSISNFDLSSITAYSVPALGNVAPTRTIAGVATGLQSPAGLFVDPAGNTWVVNHNVDSVAEFSNRSIGNVAPAVLIAGNATFIIGPKGIALDRAGDIFVSNDFDTVLEFASGSNGNVSASAFLLGVLTQLDGPQQIAIH